ncbi:alpha/beta hydrolase family protein [Shouchella patagoniensis]|uniref:alpha/beta hydrolase family protein n=1 Tax=Shouchella patagoniensis TaxID=228576 RepID=UPI000994FEF4|nr:prolyl oligopeptidase family serine peptidase [Shouchella patagoniensis]
MTLTRFIGQMQLPPHYLCCKEEMTPCPHSEAEQLVADLEKRDHPVSYLCFEDEGHFFVRTENNRTAYTETATFLTKWLQAKR